MTRNCNLSLEIANLTDPDQCHGLGALYGRPLSKRAINQTALKSRIFKVPSVQSNPPVNYGTVLLSGN